MEKATHNLKDIENWLGEKEMSKGQRYLRSLRELQVNDGNIVCKVQGSERKPYLVKLRVSGEPGNAQFHGHCSCYIGQKCKHMAAVLTACAIGQGRGLPAAVAGEDTGELVAWLEKFNAASKLPPQQKAQGPAAKEGISYSISCPPGGKEVYVQLLEQGPIGGGQAKILRGENTLQSAMALAGEDDYKALGLLSGAAKNKSAASSFLLSGALGLKIYDEIVATGRAWLTTGQGRFLPFPLMAGGEREGRIEWKVDGKGRLYPAAACEKAWVATGLGQQFIYMDPESVQTGRVKMSPSDELASRILSMPRVSAGNALIVKKALEAMDLGFGLPEPEALGIGKKEEGCGCGGQDDEGEAAERKAAQEMKDLDVAESPEEMILVLATLQPGHLQGKELNCVLPYFVYGGARFAGGSQKCFGAGENGKLIFAKRDFEREREALQGLKAMGLARQATGTHPEAAAFCLKSEADWPGFMIDVLPKLNEAGWRAERSGDFMRGVRFCGAWNAQVSSAARGSDLLDVDFGIEIEGERVPLAPLLGELFRRDPRWTDKDALEAIDDEEPAMLIAPDGSRAFILSGRLKVLARSLSDLFEGESAQAGEKIRMNMHSATRLAMLEGLLTGAGAEKVRKQAQKLAGAESPKPMDAPEGFCADLRPYQMAGLGWLQYLHKHGFGGILADDMGLGKTMQILAHLLALKNAGSLDKPAMVVVTKSLVYNWKKEARKFAPGLRVLDLTGPERKDRFARIGEFDVVLTTYGLVWRDEEDLGKHSYSVLALDEAHNIKNSRSSAGQSLRKFDARQRLCITGTPIENNLGELWSLFDFLMPEFLGGERQFAQVWRNPIERDANGQRRDILAKRVRPFILRRRKSEVAKDLPEKTVTVRSVEIDGAQRDLYEAVRSSMDKRVRDALAEKGLAKSNILVLDAMLKLRQVCCHPQLVKAGGEAAAQAESAKLELLMEMVPELASEGRRMLVFSQFTSMLDIIEGELKKEGIEYVRLDGKTENREELVERFQNGKMPVFLISLKAGGVGLNLTAADTVIHFDPWWNPAAESQATDRAHRIGQTKNVQVYKLVVAGSIEERICKLQESKAELAEGILSEDGASLRKFTQEDIEALLAPLDAGQ